MDPFFLLLVEVDEGPTDDNADPDGDTFVT